MYHSRIVLLLAATYFVTAEYDVLTYHAKATDDKIILHPEKTAGSSPRDTYRDELEETVSPIDLSSRPIEEYDSSIVEEEITPDQEQTRLLAEQNADDVKSEEKYADVEEEELEEEMGNKHRNRNFKSKPLGDIDSELKIHPTTRKMMTHHVMVDTKGRSAAEEANDEGSKSVLSDFRNVYDPQLIGIQRNGHPISYYPTLRSGMTHGPALITINPSALFKPPSSAEITTPINPSKNRLNEGNKQFHTDLPYKNSNSYPYQTPLTEISHPAHPDDYKNEVLNKLLDATNAAIMPHDDSIPSVYPLNLYPGILNPLGIRRFRRSIELKINSLSAM